MYFDPDFHYLRIVEHESVLAALRRMESQHLDTLVVVDASNFLVGTVTDGDIRRWLISKGSLAETSVIGDVANRHCQFLCSPVDSIPTYLFEHGVSAIPILDSGHKVVGVARSSSGPMRIGDFSLGAPGQVLVIAEVGLNHNGNLETALRLIDEARDSGADAVKLQLRSMSSLYRSVDSSNQAEDIGVQYILDELKDNALSVDETLSALDHVQEVGAIPLCTAWDTKSAAILEEYGVAAFKTASADLTNHPLLLQIAGYGRPMLVSTGMSTEHEIQESVRLLSSKFVPFVLLHSISSYPSAVAESNIAYMTRLKQLGNCPVGYSGHERGWIPTLTAVALGASVIERHITLDKQSKGPDHRASLEPAEFRRMIRDIHATIESLGSAEPRRLSQGEALNRVNLAKSVVAARDLTAGTVLSKTDLSVQSPGRGLQPNRLEELIGVRIRRDLAKNDFFFASDLLAVAESSISLSFPMSWGIPVRHHDYEELAVLFEPEFVEFHLSYRDLELEPPDLRRVRAGLGAVVHAPDLYEKGFLLDLASAEEEVRAKSVHALNRVAEFARDLASASGLDAAVRLVVSLGGWTSDGPMHQSEVENAYERLAEAISGVNLEGVELLAQTLPPFPWYLGGQRFCNLFVNPIDTVAFCTDAGLALCLDTSHTKLATNMLGTSFAEAVRILLPHTRHFHLVDAIGVSGEGIQVGEGEIDWPSLARSLAHLDKTYTFIPEIWQGHASSGLGFRTALRRLNSFFAQVEGVAGNYS